MGCESVTRVETGMSRSQYVAGVTVLVTGVPLGTLLFRQIGLNQTDDLFKKFNVESGSQSNKV